MHIIDINLTIGGRDNSGRLMDMKSLLRLMDDNGITHGVCYHQFAKLDPKQGNTLMAELAAKTQGRIGVCAVLDPILDAENLSGEGGLTERLRAFAPECIRIFPDDCRVPFHPFYWEEILNAANELSMPLLIDCGYTPDFWCRLPDIALQYPNVKFVLLGQGCCNSRVIMPVLRRCGNVYFTAERMCDHLQIEEITEECGVSNLLFGSGYPARPHAGALGLALYADITPEQRENILSKNWEEIRYDPA